LLSATTSAVPIEILALKCQHCGQNATIPYSNVIGEIGHNSQRLDTCSALQRAGCVILAATFPVFGWFLGRDAADCRILATVPPSRRRKYGSAVNPLVMKRLPESS
jgi:hypothetical protein